MHGSSARPRALASTEMPVPSVRRRSGDDVIPTMKDRRLAEGALEAT